MTTSKTQTYLIIGGRSEAGQSAIAAIREHDARSRIIGTTSAEPPGGDGPHQTAESLAAPSDSGLDYLIGGVDLNASSAIDRLLAGLAAIDPALTSEASAIDVIFFTPAFGPIGYPISAATNEDADAAIAFSAAPLRTLADRLRPRLSVGYSAFYWLPHAMVGYGSMAYAKLMLDTLAHNDPRRFRVIRGGTFRSPATRGIGLLLQRALRSTPHAELKELGARFKATGGKFSDFFFNFAFEQENIAFGEFHMDDHRATDREDLTKATLMLLRGETTAPGICVIGDWIWTEEQMPELDREIFKIQHEVLRRHGLA